MRNKTYQGPIRGKTPARNISQNERVISIAGGSLILLSGIKNVARNPTTSFVKFVAGGYLLYRGSTGHCPLNEALGRNTASWDSDTVSIRETLTVNRPKDEVYSFWRQLENLPQFMKHLDEVTQTSPTRSHWKAKATPKLGSLEWDADITSERDGEYISWKSLPQSTVENWGEVRFLEAPGNRGTEVHATISYRPPAGELGKMAARFLNKPFSLMVREDLRRFKRMIETGEQLELDGQPAARKKKGMAFNF